MKHFFSQIQYHVAYKKVDEDMYHIIQNNKNSWCADPFIFRYRGDTYIFAEMWDNLKERGVIAYAKWKNGYFGRWIPVIDEGYHMSFPNVFMKGEEVYMIPETSAVGTISLYRALEFPDKWERCEILYTGGKYVDTCFMHWNGHTYGFTYKINEERDTSIGKLYRFELVEQKVLDFVENPITDLDRVARPAGNFVYREDKTYRVSQNCEGIYGNGLIFSEVHFDGKRYFEQIVKEVYPTDLKLTKRYNIIGCHTYNEEGDWQVIDIRHKDKGLGIFAMKLRNKLIRGLKRN